ncbi:Phosphomevalonate kinase [Nesidiocoris tenuis]|uniref:Phosphomevalonate kinase n=1 Tax=Nesidiocoris tenuis TaxID=355587 RepID=A0ABN7B954_9HEMI|nr:Phosphomevalonate kinase [Nesidiocoris tenuis]
MNTQVVGQKLQIGGMDGNPRKILVFSGKRKSGKDYITDKLFGEMDSSKTALIRLSAPLKTEWAKGRGLDVAELLSSSEYKERYRAEMVIWGEEMRKSDPGYFARAAIDMFQASDKPFWIIGDARRKTDVKWLVDNFGDKVFTVRIRCSDDVRAGRNWKFTCGIDDAETECDLDDYAPWDLIIDNNGQDLTETINGLIRVFLDS